MVEKYKLRLSLKFDEGFEEVYLAHQAVSNL